MAKFRPPVAPKQRMDFGDTWNIGVTLKSLRFYLTVLTSNLNRHFQAKY